QQIETVRIPIAKLDPLFLQAEEMIQNKIVAAQRTTELKLILDFIETWKKENIKWDSHHSTESGAQQKEIIDSANEKLDELAAKMISIYHALNNDQRMLGRMIDDHVESMKSILMLPISTIVEGFPKLVRELARSKGKEVELIINGKEIEVDKRILEELKDPLIHLVRNCIDHGIGKPNERKKIGKPVQGKVTLNFNTTESRHIEIIVADDGSGIDLEKVRSAALKAGVVTKDSCDKLTTPEIFMLIFQSGISTSQIITDISGRGLGLAIVREKVEKLGGTVTVESQPKIGTTFRLILPLTLSTLRGVLIKTGEHLYAVPTINIDRTLRVKRDEIKTVENKDTIMIGGKILSVVNLGKVLKQTNGNSNISNKKKSEDDQTSLVQLLVINYADKKLAFIVDEILEECQLLVKELGKQLNRVRNINGATVLGSGKIVPVINVSDLMKSAINTDVLTKEQREEGTETSKQNKILVIDDSITSRTLIKNIVETAGYVVETAVDGIDAFTKALVGEYDLIVSDVDMPRMNGFELTSKIRKEKKLSELPVVLVTALESREDREHGIDVGADAYIVKSSFDQSNLLEVIKKLL
ncbi:MAG: response regulator, partial [Ignavibacteria bacterium]|nr:response regulator [Ignavibacteria bacterium]